MLPISWAHLRTHVVPQFCLVNLDHHHITIVCQVLIESLRVGFQEFSLFHRANLFLLERRTSTQHLPRNVQSWNFQNLSFYCAHPLCFCAKWDESSESSQKRLKMPFVVLDSLHSHRFGQVSRAVNVATPAEQNGSIKEILPIKEIINTYLRTAMW